MSAHGLPVRSSAVVAFVVATALAVSACGGGADHTLRGVVRTPPPQVDSITLPEVTTTDAGTPFRFAAPVRGLLLVYFGFTTCPDLCPTTMGDIRSVLARLGASRRRVEVAFVTVDPQRDTPAMLRSFLDHFVAGAHAIRTTDADALRRAEAAFRVTSRRTTATYFEHSASVMVVNDSGTIVDEFPYGLSHDQMQHDLVELLRRIDDERAS